MKATYGVLGLALLAALGCSSTPKTTSERIEATSRDEYLKAVDRRLDTFEEQTENMQGAKAARMKADIEDTRARVKIMEAAPDARWEEFREPIDQRLSDIQHLSEGSKAE